MEDSASDTERREAESVCSDAKMSEKSSGKTRKRTPRASKQELDVLKNQFTSLDGKVDSLMSFLKENLLSKDTEGSALPRPVENVSVVECSDRRDIVSDIACGQRPTVPVASHTVSTAERRPPLVTLSNTLNDTYGLSNPDDAVSLQPDRNERNLLFGTTSTCSDGVSHVQDKQGDTVSDRFAKYSSNAALADIFGEDASDSVATKNGIILDDSQVKVLEESWRCKEPSRVTSFKDSYRNEFPISEQCDDLLKVPSLDEIVEHLLFKRFGSKAVSKGQSLYNQPLKSLEKIAYQGQYAARMGIIINSYVQQALGKLLLTLQEQSPNIDRAIQCVRDIFAMSNKSLDQSARSGALFHLIRRRATMEETGLSELKDVKQHVWNLPLSHKGVFGEGLEKTLRERQELNKQISDLLPEMDRKRKVSYQAGPTQYKKPRYSQPNKENRSYTPGYTPGKNARQGQTGTLRNYTIPKFSRATSQKGTTVSSFRNNNKSQ